MRDQPQQDIEHLRAEIRFRAKLAQQHVTGDVLLPEYYAKEEHDVILRRRIDDTRRKMEELAEVGVRLSPFLELGAERGQRSLVLTNDFGAEGVAADISYHQLKTMEHFAELFGMTRLPARICCDATTLPFRTETIPFVFAYQFLHHFPSPAPVIREIHRVMADGRFYFAEEPYRRLVKVALYSRKRSARARSGIRGNRYIQLIESFISSETSEETDHGIIENDEISLGAWIEGLSIFDEWKGHLSSIYDIASPVRNRIAARNLPNWLLGGLIEGLCRKRGGASPRTIAESFACPDCTTTAPDGRLDRPPVTPVPGGYRCSMCDTTYPDRDGIIFLLPRAMLAALYPEFAAT